MPVVSVILPVYNAEKYVEQSVRSILDQSLADFELIVIDDASTDRTLEIVGSFGDRRIRVLRKERNTGLTVSLNLGLSVATGKYIARMDADDVSLPGRLARQVGFLEVNSAYGVCGSWVQTIGEGAGLVKKYPLTHEAITVGLLVKSPFCHPAVVLRKSVLDANALQYDAAMEPAEDYDLWMKLVRHTRACNLPEVLLHYRIHPAQVSRERIRQQLVLNARLQGELMKGLGVAFGGPEQQLHADLVGTARLTDAPQTRLLLGWLRRLKKANRVSRFFPEPAFGDFIRHYAFRTYSRSYGLSLRLLLFGLRHGVSPLAAGDVPVAKKAGLLLKCLAGGARKVPAA